MKCPVCSTANLVMSERQGIEIDYCPECRGVWLDRGELDKIIERSINPQEAPAHRTAPVQQPYYQQPEHLHGHYHGNKPYRKKSFLEELFD
ncbi:zf-TFIIB domain-containing protein [Geobacter sp. SVR]|uniref:TFIIB-type zinc ribbon-containing protein n=1 Tax=Geobacter sp. SVR TaxID=2495594 RepID=UPI00143EF503|nr:zf-TFIIB domain-containing protein [Geobacter sp. SVR]BCS52794.1 hypothetical protein GSVR_11020 [Geobacter sp. SVR]GCF86660.1 hypothetical protein GSbR_32600 [Geobacter sp. SVR]